MIFARRWKWSADRMDVPFEQTLTDFNEQEGLQDDVDWISKLRLASVATAQISLHKSDFIALLLRDEVQ